MVTSCLVQMASTVYLHVGQCGNQVGEVYWRRASKEYGLDGKRRMLHNLFTSLSGVVVRQGR